MRQVILNIHGIGVPARTPEPGEDAYWITPSFFSDVLALCDDLQDRAQTDFTFDDGNLSDLETGADRLAASGRKARFFVLSSRIDQPGSLGAADIQTLQTMGHEIGSHGADHVDWTALDAAGFVRELDDARAILQDVTGGAVAAAAIPFGRYNARVLKELQTRGYVRAYSSDGGAWHGGQFPVPRSSLRANMTLDEVEAILLGREYLHRRLRRGLSMAMKRRV